jgi:hypothetical protein
VYGCVTTIIDRLSLFIDRPSLFIDRLSLFIDRPSLFIDRLSLFIDRPPLLSIARHYYRSPATIIDRVCHANRASNLLIMIIAPRV